MHTYLQLLILQITSRMLCLKGYTAEETAENSIKIRQDMGTPNQILSGQGQNFVSKFLKQVTDRFAIAKIRHLLNIKSLMAHLNFFIQP